MGAEQDNLARSATISRIQLYIPQDLAHDTTKALGDIGLFQPEDLSMFSRHDG